MKKKFRLSPVDEVHLHHAPLAKALMQVQFSRTPQLVSDTAETLIADALGRYPVRRRQVAVSPEMFVNGQQVAIPQAIPAAILTFAVTDGTWQVTLTDTAVALETTAYQSRDDLIDRCHEVLLAIASVALPPVVDRVGLRYIDRLSGTALSRVPEYVVPQLQVLHGGIEPELELQHSVTDSVIKISPNEVLQVRSGLLPAGAGFDPALSPLLDTSWVLDMDAYTTEAGFPFDPDALTTKIRSYSETIYAFFRWATTDIFEADHIGDTTTANEAQ